MYNPYGNAADAYQQQQQQQYQQQQQQPHSTNLQHPQPIHHVSSHQPPPGAAGGQFNFLNDPAAALASQFARSGFEQSNQYFKKILAVYKVILVLFPS